MKNSGSHFSEMKQSLLSINQAYQEKQVNQINKSNIK
jgi:hypothetical protein